MQLLQVIILTSSNLRVPGMHSNCSTIRAGDQLRSYTSERQWRLTWLLERCRYYHLA